MENAIALQDWVKALESEYLTDYVKTGGAAVKFVVAPDFTSLAEVRRMIADAGACHNYICAFVDSSRTRIHLIDQVFAEVARQVNWDDLAHRFLIRLLEGHYYYPPDPAQMSLATLAKLNGAEEPEIRKEIKNRLKDELLHDFSMSREFRYAMSALIGHTLDPSGADPGIDETVKNWLKGEAELRPLKSINIFQRVNRSNARYLIHSLSHWLHRSGHSGLLLMLDIGRYLEDRGKSTDGTLAYRKSTVLECYEVLRQFLDGVDDSAYMMIVVVAPPSFADEDYSRSVDRYQALKLRIWDEVRDRRLANPLAPMVRLAK